MGALVIKNVFNYSKCLRVGAGAYDGPEVNTPGPIFACQAAALLASSTRATLA